MALQFMEGFDRIGVGADLLPKWQESNPSGTFPAGRFGGQSIDLDVGQFMVAPCTDPGTSNKIIVGMALKIPTLGNGILLSFRDRNSVLMTFNLNTDGTFDFDSGSVVFTTTGVITAATWHYVEVKVLFHATAGTVDVKIDGENLEFDTGLVTINAGTECDNILLDNGPVSNANFDDFYIGDTSGGFDFLNDPRISSLVPNADNGTPDFTRSEGSNNFANVDEATPDGDATFNHSITSTDRDLFDFASFGIDVGATVHGVGINMGIQKQDAGAGDIRSVTVSSASTATGASHPAGVGNYNNFVEIEELDPNGSIAWTPASIDAAKFGYEIP